MKDYSIYIPTYRRIDRQLTWNNLPDFLKKRVVFVLARDEVLPFKTIYPGARDYLDCSIQGTSIGRVRKWIMTHADETDEALIMLDDDVDFKAYNSLSGKFEKAGDDEFKQYFSWLQLFPEDVFMQSLGTTYFNTGSRTWEDNRSNHISFWINRELCRQNGIFFDVSLPSLEDVDFTLSGLSKGFRTRSCMHFCGVMGTIAKGGISTDAYRGDKHKKACEKLVERYPDFVRLRTNKALVHLKNFGTEVDITVQWKKAYKVGKAKNS